MDNNFVNKIIKAIEPLPTDLEKVAFMNGALWGVDECRKMQLEANPDYAKLLNINSDTEDDKIL